MREKEEEFKGIVKSDCISAAQIQSRDQLSTVKRVTLATCKPVSGRVEVEVEADRNEVQDGRGGWDRNSTEDRGHRSAQSVGREENKAVCVQSGGWQRVAITAHLFAMSM